MRVLHVHSGNLYGGVETLMLTLAERRQFVSSLDPEFALCFEGQLAKALKAVDAPLYHLGNVRTRNPLSVLRARRRLSNLLTTRSYDAVICHMPWAQAIFGPVVRRYKIGLVFWMHGTASGDHWVERWAAMTQPDLAICNSKFTRSTLRYLYPKVSSEVVHCPVDVGVSHRSISERTSVREELGTNQEAIVIVQASRMEPWKGQMLHLEALGRLRDMHDWVCWQVGGPQLSDEKIYFEKLKQKSYELGIADRVKFLGQQSDVMRIFRAADVYCQPNASPEPFGIVFIEALSAGLTVVSAAIGGPLEIIDESCGILVPPGNTEALANALGYLIRNPVERYKLAGAGPPRAAHLCDPRKQIRKLSKVLHHSVLKLGRLNDDSDGE